MPLLTDNLVVNNTIILKDKVNMLDSATIAAARPVYHPDDLLKQQAQIATEAKPKVNNDRHKIGTFKNSAYLQDMVSSKK